MFLLMLTTYKPEIMNKSSLIILIILAAFFVVPVNAQEKQETTIGQSLGLFVFPSQDQNKEQQDKDEYECFKWAKQQTGVDPLNLPETEAEKVDRSADGTAVRGAARGAAAGAAIGAIAGDTGKGAAIGAVAGGLRGRRAKVVGDEMEQQANNQAAAAIDEEKMNNFKKAFSACMEGKGYTIK